MIKNLAALIDAFIRAEKEMLSKYHIVEHTTMIGDMYEELTKEVFEKVTIPDLDLRVVSGKVRMPDGSFSSQTDCMLVVGAGDQLPRTKNYIYDKKNVIATVEVKKNLFTNEISDAFGKLNSVRNEFPEDLLPYEDHLIFEGFCSVLYGVKHKENMDDYTLTQYHAYRNLMLDAVNPLKIVFAYEGLTDVKGLRKSLLKVVNNKIGQSGFEPSNFPDVILCGDKSLVKMNGLPYGSPITPDGIWLFYASCTDNPLAVLISMIWYRLMKRFSLGYDIFEHKLNVSSFDIFLGAEYVQADEKQGWMLHDFPDQWTTRDVYAHPDGPIRLTELEYSVSLRLLKEKTISIDDVELNNAIRKNETIISIFVQHLMNMGILEIDRDQIRLTKTEYVFFKTRNEHFFAVEKDNLYQVELLKSQL